MHAGFFCLRILRQTKWTISFEGNEWRNFIRKLMRMLEELTDIRNDAHVSCARRVVCSLQFAVCSLQFAVCSLQFAVCSLQFAAYRLVPPNSAAILPFCGLSDDDVLASVVFSSADDGDDAGVEGS
jgi:hypothetical protein